MSGPSNIKDDGSDRDDEIRKPSAEYIFNSRWFAPPAAAATPASLAQSKVRDNSGLWLSSDASYAAARSEVADGLGFSSSTAVALSSNVGDGSGFLSSFVLVPSEKEPTADEDDEGDAGIALRANQCERVHRFSSAGYLINRSSTSWTEHERLGRGSFGTVCKGEADDGFLFAVKFVPLSGGREKGEQSLLQLRQEINLLRQFKHENIVQYLGTDEDQERLYLFLEFMPKGSLLSLFDKDELTESQVHIFTWQILNGLKHLHDRNVIHRDIKCANILVDGSGSAKLADFGLAKDTSTDAAKSVKGTLAWMAPEGIKARIMPFVNIRGKNFNMNVRRQIPRVALKVRSISQICVVFNSHYYGNYYGLRADIWSLGCTILEMLTRRRPYSNLSPDKAKLALARGKPPQVPKSLPDDAQNFICRCCQRDPNARPSAAELLNDPFVRKPPASR